MLIRTQAEIREFAATFVNGFVADLLIEFPGVDKVVYKPRGNAWTQFLDDAIEQMADKMLTKFGSSD